VGVPDDVAGRAGRAEPEQVDAAGRAVRDALSDRQLRGGASMVIGVAGCEDRCGGLVAAACITPLTTSL
jgi:hypothetical protein